MCCKVDKDSETMIVIVCKRLCEKKLYSIAFHAKKLRGKDKKQITLLPCFFASLRENGDEGFF